MYDGNHLSKDKDQVWIPFRCGFIDPATGKRCENRAQKFRRRMGKYDWIQAKPLEACPPGHVKVYSTGQANYKVDGEPSAEQLDVSKYPVVVA
jgi:hypothetical protein